MTNYNLDPAIRPQDDLFRNVNGHWLATSPIADDRSSAGVFTKLADEAEEAIREIVTSLSGSEAGTEAKKVEDLFTSFMDEEHIAALGVEPLLPLLAEIDAISSIADLLAYFGNSIRRGTGAPIGLDVEADPANPTQYALFVEQAGLGLPDEEYYRLPQHAPILAKYREHVDKMFALADLGIGPSGTIVALETDIAAHHWNKVRVRDMRAM
ncbi:MAG: M13 family metallopeptidase, partial [Propionibacteriaceae bacterium]|nr:M13 family metallopeptidase [Propionibacteriaceae bacterium]